MTPGGNLYPKVILSMFQVIQSLQYLCVRILNICMKVNAQHIIDETVAIFENSKAGELFKKNSNTVSNADYKLLHPAPLTATSIFIDCDQFKNDISQWQPAFEKWGKEHTHLPRYGAALVNQSGAIVKNDPINGSLAAWNKDNPDIPLIETDCRLTTPLMSIKSLQPLQIFNNYWCRSNILKWDIDARFMPHIDTIVPSPWIRLWASMNPEIIIRFYNPESQELEAVNFEPGRVYIIDTSIVHDAYATADNVYQLFLSVDPSAVPVILSVKDPKPV